MADTNSILVAALAGFSCAAVFSALPGPINLTILNAASTPTCRMPPPNNLR